jgi:hypothetical protein
MRVCSGGVCGRQDLQAGTVVATQSAGDCKQNVCDGQGGITTAAALADVPIDNNPCTDDLCTGGVPTNPPRAAGTACAQGAGKVCDGSGACVQCLQSADCATGVCLGHACVTLACTNGVTDGAETDVDCGGACPPCAALKSCKVAADCQSGVCTGGLCQQPTCSDTVRNGTETGVDCGGPVCSKCGPGLGCTQNIDCRGGACVAGTCAASCTDLVKNGTETDTDCGGTCPKCALGKACTQGADCTSGACVSGTCAVATCNDTLLDGTETDVDCGGGSCPTCAAGKHCQKDADCLTTWCGSAKICLFPDCNDAVKNGPETDVDCGGPVCARCAVGKHCAVGSDCTSAVCTGGVCQGATCTDGAKNAAETDVDCGGGTCPKCAAGKGCGAATDCLSAVCSGGACQAATCGDAVKNGSESDVDCGGAACAKCAVGKLCGSPADCVSSVCTGGTCQAPSCFDSVLDNGETDVDCGGPNCGKCKTGQHCAATTDCQSAVCTGGVCQAATCGDGVQNGLETGVDCGGPSCPICPTVLLVGTSATGVLGAELHPGGSWIGSTLADSSNFAPSLTFTSAGLGMLAITSPSNGGEVHTATWTGTGWSAPALVTQGATSRGAPVIEASGTGVAHLVYQSPTYFFWYLAFSSGTGWTTFPEQMGAGTAQSYGPVPASIAAVGATPTAAFLDGQSPNVNWAAARDRVGGSWQARVDLAGNTNFNLTPAIAALSSGPELMMVYVQSDTKIMAMTRTGGAWSAPAYLNNCLTNDRPALTALPNGGAMLAFRGTDGMLYWSRYASGAWSPVAPFSSPNVAVSAPPAVAHGIGGNVAEIAFVEGDGKAYHARHDGTAWGAPVQVGGASLVGVAIATSP